MLDGEREVEEKAEEVLDDTRIGDIIEQAILSPPDPAMPPALTKPEATIAIELGDISGEQLEEVQTKGQYWTIKQLATELGYTTIWVHKLCQAGRIAAIKPFGGHWRIPDSEAQRVMKEGATPMARIPKSDGAEAIEVPEEKLDLIVPKRKEKEKAGAEESESWFTLPFGLGRKK